ncbi:hypothetical protein DM806_01655 [Sphingobium lactosutens]|nr:hypothetical protein [Sphingobium lactosutens]
MMGIGVSEQASIAQLLPGPSSQITDYALPNVLSGPCEIEFDRRGKAWIEEVVGNAITRYDPSSGQFTRYPLSQPGALPGGIEIGPDDGIWFPELTANRITRIDAVTGTSESYPIPFGQIVSGTLNIGAAVATDMAAGPDNGIWFSMSGMGAIGRIDITTKQVEVITLPTPLSTVSALTQIIQRGPGNLMVISLAAANKIATIDVFTRQIKEYTIPTPAALPQGVTTDRDGMIWFTETGAQKFGKLDVNTGQIQEFSILALRAQIGLQLSLGNPLPFPGPIRQGSDGKIYFAQGGFEAGNKIGQYDPLTGTYKEFIVPTAAAGICDINNSQDGAIWFGEFTGNKIGKLRITS